MSQSVMTVDFCLSQTGRLDKACAIPVKPDKTTENARKIFFHPDFTVILGAYKAIFTNMFVKT
jgi:hypothetical protein